MSEEEDFSKLPIDVKWRHSKWKARQSGYEDVISGLARGNLDFHPSAEDLKLCASDANVIALESGIKVVSAILQSLSTESGNPVSIRQAVVRPMAEKGLVAAKPAVKQATIEALLTFVEVADPAGVVEDILAIISSAKSPKAIAAGIQTLDSVFKEFGSPVTDPRPVLKVLPGMFGHTDRNVRQAASGLACSLCRWTGEPVILQVLSSIKPVQLNELKTSIAKMDTTVAPARLTRQQKLAQEQESGGGAGDDSGAVADEAALDSNDANSNGANEAAIDPWDLADPVNVVSRIPDTFWELLSSVKWKERHEALDSVVPLLEKTQKMDPNSDYSRLVGELVRIAQKDMNQMCATQAVQGLCSLALGLRQQYSQYSQRTLEAIIERFKEKKQTVIEVVVKAIDAVFFQVLGSKFAQLLETVVELGMKHKTPQVRIESTKYCAHALCETTSMPKGSEIEEIGAVAVKLLGESSEPMRAAAASVLAALVKLCGASKMAHITDSLDDHKKKRISNAVESTTVKAKVSKQPPSSSSNTGAKPTAASANAKRPTPDTLAPPGNAARPAGSLRPNPPQPSSRPPPRTSAPPPGSGRPAPSLASPPSRRAPLVSNNADMSMGLTSPSPVNQSAQRSGRPSLSSTPKIVKRTSTNADFTPARGVDTFRRRIYSPAKPQNGSPSQNTSYVEPMEVDVGEFARLTAELELEKSLRLDAEKRLARVQVEKDREILRLQEENSVLKVQIKAQKEEFESWVKTREQRWSQASLSSDDVGNRLSVLSLDAELNNVKKPQPVPTSRPPSRRPPSRVLPISAKPSGPPDNNTVNTTAVRTGNDDWERAVSMTHSLRQRVELLKQQKQRNMTP